MNQPLQLLSDCPSCRVESAIVELILPGQPAVGTCRLCGYSIEGGSVVALGQRFDGAASVVAALERWAASEGEVPSVFVAANFAAGTIDGVAAQVVAGSRVETSFDVVAWLFRSRTTGAMAVGAPAAQATAAGGDEAGSGGGGASPPATPPGGRAAPEVPREAIAPAPDPRAVTRALAATALADGTLEAVERNAIAEACTRLGAPQPTDEDWRAWRPQQVGLPPDPPATVAAMIRVALADRIPDIGEARLIREFARAWQVKVVEPVLPPVTMAQKASAAWLGLFAR